MALSCFGDKSAPPSEDALTAALGTSAGLWRALIARIGERFAPLDAIWGFSGKSAGWGLRLRQGSRTILYMTPREGHFLASFALGEKAVALAEASKLPRDVRAIIERAPKYAEGRGVRLEIRKSRDLAAVETIAVAKMST
jgi:hypothetical protein